MPAGRAGKHLLKPDKYKDVIIDSLKFMVKEKRVQVNAFVIMSNHIHLIWQIQKDFKRENVQRDFLKFTSQMNEELVKHYRNYPDTSEGFPDWSNKLNRYLSEAFTKFA